MSTAEWERLQKSEEQIDDEGIDAWREAREEQSKKVLTLRARRIAHRWWHEWVAPHIVILNATVSSLTRVHNWVYCGICGARTRP